jgi:hypothetical protein
MHIINQNNIPQLQHQHVVIKDTNLAKLQPNQSPSKENILRARGENAKKHETINHS